MAFDSQEKLFEIKKNELKKTLQINGFQHSEIEPILDERNIHSDKLMILVSSQRKSVARLKRIYPGTKFLIYAWR